MNSLYRIYNKEVKKSGESFAMCDKHYEEWIKEGLPNILIVSKIAENSEEECNHCWGERMKKKMRKINKNETRCGCKSINNNWNPGPARPGNMESCPSKETLRRVHPSGSLTQGDSMLKPIASPSASSRYLSIELSRAL